MNLWFILFLLWCMVGFATPRNVNKAKNTKLRNPSPQFDILQIIDKEEHTLPPWALEEVYSMATNTLSTPPPCIKDESDLGYVSGMLSATQTFYNCLNAITDPMSLPNFYNGTANGNVTIYTSIQLNNLHQVDAVTGTITVDFYLRLYWQDNRFAMPLFWSRVDPKIRKNGFEITPLITNGNTTTVGVFMPDIRFHDAAELDYIVQTIRFNSSNVFFWSRHTVATFMQPKMTFDRYPADSQIFHLRYGSYAYDQTWLRMGFTTNPAAISMNLNYDGSATFLSNPEWQYSADSTSYETYISSSGFVNAIYHIGIRRRGSGIVLRLILPITLLCFLGGLTFWAEFSSRVNSTITLLLSVSALYIVILANIPLVGYLTEMDTFIFWMFLLLVFAVILHQIYATIQEENDIWPLRIFYGRFIEFLGRIGFFPLVTFFFLYHIGDVTPAIERGLIAVTIIIGTFILIKEGSDLKAHYKLAVKLLLQKLNSEDLLIKDLSPVELLLVNNLKFQKLSTSPVYVAEYLEIIGGLDIPKSRSLPLRRYSAGRQLSKRKITVPDDLSEEDDEIEQISREASLRAVEIVHERQKSGYYHFQKSSSQDEEEIKQIQKEASLRAVQIVKERQRSGSYHFSRTPSKDNVEIEPVQRQESLRQDSLRAVQIIQERQKSGYYRFFSRSPSENVKHEMTYKGLKSVNSGDRASGGFDFQEENPQRVNTQPHITLEEETIQAVTRKESNSSLTSATITQPSPLRSSLRSKSLGSPVKESMSEKKTVVFSDNNPRDFGLQDHSLDNHDGENEKSSFNY